MSGLMVFDTPEAIDAYRLLALRQMLKLEVKGMKRRGPAAFSVIKKEFKLKGTKASVLEQYTSILKENNILVDKK